MHGYQNRPFSNAMDNESNYAVALRSLRARRLPNCEFNHRPQIAPLQRARHSQVVFLDAVVHRFVFWEAALCFFGMLRPAGAREFGISMGSRCCNGWLIAFTIGSPLAKGWSVQSYAGRRYLWGLCCIIPDNKPVEDTGNYLRDLGRHGRNFISSRVSRMAAAINSMRLESRQLAHRRVTKTIFKAKFNQRKYTGKACVFCADPCLHRGYGQD